MQVRLRTLGPLEPRAVLSQLLPPASPLWGFPLVGRRATHDAQLPVGTRCPVPRSSHCTGCALQVGRLAASSADVFTCGALIQWWTMFSIVAADVAAYFAGKRFGRTPLVEVPPHRLTPVGMCMGMGMGMSMGMGTCACSHVCMGAARGPSRVHTCR